MKTLENVINGRKDFPVFAGMSNDEIIEYLKQRDWSYHNITIQGEEINVRDEYGTDVFKIIDVRVIGK